MDKSQKWAYWNTVLKKEESPILNYNSDHVRAWLAPVVISLIAGLMLLIIQPPFVTSKPSTRYEFPSVSMTKIFTWMFIVLGIIAVLQICQQKTSAGMDPPVVS